MRPLLKAQLEESAGARRPIPARSFSKPPLRSPLCRAWHPKQQTPLSGETPQSGETPLCGFPLAGGGGGWGSLLSLAHRGCSKLPSTRWVPDSNPSSLRFGESPILQSTLNRSAAHLCSCSVVQWLRAEGRMVQPDIDEKSDSFEWRRRGTCMSRLTRCLAPSWVRWRPWVRWCPVKQPAIKGEVPGGAWPACERAGDRSDTLVSDCSSVERRWHGQDDSGPSTVGKVGNCREVWVYA